MSNLLEIGGQVSCDVSLDCEGEDETSRIIGKQVVEILDQLAPNSAAVDDIEVCVGKVKAAQQGQHFGQKYSVYTHSTGPMSHVTENTSLHKHVDQMVHSWCLRSLPRYKKIIRMGERTSDSRPIVYQR